MALTLFPVSFTTAPATTPAALIFTLDGKVWNGSSLVAYASASYATYPVNLSQLGASRFWHLTVPATLPAGTYLVTVTTPAVSSTPVEGTDAIVRSDRMDWDGTNLLGEYANLRPATAGATLAVSGGVASAQLANGVVHGGSTAKLSLGSSDGTAPLSVVSSHDGTAAVSLLATGVVAPAMFLNASGADAPGLSITSENGGAVLIRNENDVGRAAVLIERNQGYPAVSIEDSGGPGSWGSGENNQIGTMRVVLDANMSRSVLGGGGDTLLGTGVRAVDSAGNAIPTAAQNAAATLAAGNVDGFTLEQTLRLCLAALAGKMSGAGGTTITIRAANDSKNRIVATVSGDGRSAVTLTAT